MITLTEIAKEKLLELRTSENKEGYYLRVGVDGSGCAGLSYIMVFDDVINVNDTVCEFDVIKVLIDKKSLLYLAGTELDFSDGLNGKGFVWANPSASRVCGCGNSFSV